MMRTFRAGRLGLLGLAALLMAGLAGAALADGVGPRPKKTPAVQKAEQKAVEQRFGQTGEITLASGQLRLNVPANYYFLPAPEARAYLQRIGAPNPPGQVLGMIAPSGARPIDDGFWGAIVSINPMGYVAEERADRFAAADFLGEVRDARPAAGPRPEAFAATPAHDAPRHLVTWTERYPGPATARTIRSEQRLLGRSAVAGITVDARVDQAAAAIAAGPEIGRMVSFTSGNAYGDYRPGSDPAPLYDLPSLLTLKTRPTPTAAPVAPAAPTAPVSSEPLPGIPAQSNGLQQVGEPDSAPAAAAFSMDDIQKWLPWIGGGLLLLAIVPWLVGMARRPEGEGAKPPRERRSRRKTDEPPRQDPNLTPTDG